MLNRKSLWLVGAIGAAMFLTFIVSFKKAPSPPEDQSITVAAYNIKWLGHWSQDFSKLAKVISQFDVCGIVEVKDEDTLDDLVLELERHTKADWGYVYGHRTHRPSSTRNHYIEAYAFLWNRDKVAIGDGMISNVWDPQECFRNDPYIASFKAGDFDFTIMLVHTRWSDDSDGTRKDEVAAFADRISYLKGFMGERDIILAGDFNYSGTTNAMQDMAKACGFTQLDQNPKTTFTGDNRAYNNAYDHMYIGPATKLEYVDSSCVALDATKLVYGDNSPENMAASKKYLSDHLPIMATFSINKGDDD